MKKEINSKRFFSAMAFVAIIFLAIALLISLIATKLGSNGSDVFSKIASIVRQIAQALAYVCACISAYGYVRSKRSAVYIVIYVIACVMIAVFVVLPIFGI